MVLKTENVAMSVGRRDGEMARQDRIALYCELDEGRKRAQGKQEKNGAMRSTDAREAQREEGPSSEQRAECGARYGRKQRRVAMSGE